MEEFLRRYKEAQKRCPSSEAFLKDIIKARSEDRIRLMPYIYLITRDPAIEDYPDDKDDGVAQFFRSHLTGVGVTIDNNNVYIEADSDKIYTAFTHTALIVIAATLLSTMHWFKECKSLPTANEVQSAIIKFAVAHNDTIREMSRKLCERDTYTGIFIINEFYRKHGIPADVRIRTLPYTNVFFGSYYDDTQVLISRCGKIEIRFAEGGADDNVRDPISANVDSLFTILKTMILDSEYVNGKKITYCGTALAFPEMSDEERWKLTTRLTEYKPC